MVCRIVAPFGCCVKFSFEFKIPISHHGSHPKHSESPSSRRNRLHQSIHRLRVLTVQAIAISQGKDPKSSCCFFCWLLIHFTVPPFGDFFRRPCSFLSSRVYQWFASTISGFGGFASTISGFGGFASTISGFSGLASFYPD